MRRWFRSLTVKRVPQALGVYLVTSLMVLELARMVARYLAMPTDWIGFLALVLLGLSPLVGICVFRRRD